MIHLNFYFYFIFDTGEGNRGEADNREGGGGADGGNPQEWHAMDRIKSRVRGKRLFRDKRK